MADFRKSLQKNNVFSTKLHIAVIRGGSNLAKPGQEVVDANGGKRNKIAVCPQNGYCNCGSEHRQSRNPKISAFFFNSD